MAAAGIILAGGQNRRMGQNKAFLEVEGERIIVRLLRLLEPLVEECLVVTNDPEPYTYLGVRLVGDRLRGYGPLGGLEAGLNATRAAKNLVLACDLPFVERPLLAYLLSQAPGYDVVVPEVQGYLEPLVAVYDRRCLPVIRGYLQEGGKPKVTGFFGRVALRKLPEEELARVCDPRTAFLNINTPQQLAQAFPGRHDPRA